MQKIHPMLWFNTQAEEAAEFYTSLFPDSRITDVARFGDGSPGTAGTVMTVSFELAGQQLTALNGGPEFNFTEAISLYVDCADQAEVDRLWERLTDGGEPGQCGWLKDRFGVSWQVIPSALGELMGDPDPERAGRVVQAMLQMTKIDVEGLRHAWAGDEPVA
ncbi:MAG: VOC family protein [Dehalococcoidia bacterium]|nr:VOC family protein [Dehalococcoidia bacterium]